MARRWFRRVTSTVSQLWSRTSSGQVPSSSNSAASEKLEAEFREQIRTLRNRQRESEQSAVASFENMAVVVEEVLRTARDHVIFYGDDLPAHVFLARGVREAMCDFVRRNPTRGRITVITNECTRGLSYVEQLAEFTDVVVDPAHIRLLPLRAAHAAHQFYLVVTDSTPGPSVWYWGKGLVNSYYQFYSCSVGHVQAQFLSKLIAEFGSPPQA